MIPRIPFLIRWFVFAALSSAVFGSAQAQMSATVMEQIQSLAADKLARTAAQNKIDSQLLYAARMERGEPITSKVPVLAVNVDVIDGRAAVDIIGTISPALLDQLNANGARVISSTPELHAVRVEIGLDRLEEIAGLPEVRSIVPERKSHSSPVPAETTFAAREQQVADQLSKVLSPTPGTGGGAITAAPQTQTGDVVSEGDVTHRASEARRVFNTTGAGIKIGVLAAGATHITEAQATGDLPADVVVLPGQAGSGDNGTPLLEIIHDLAPDAKLYFATSDPTPENFAANIQKLRDAGCDIIVDDAFYFTETPFQDGQSATVISTQNAGIIAQAVNNVTASGALYFSAAGNNGNLNDTTAGVWEGDFVNAGTLAIIGGAGAGPVNDFDNSAAVSQFDRITVGANAPITLFWSDPLGASANDYDLYVLNGAGTALVAASTSTQDGTQDPFETVGAGANAANNRVVVAKFAGADRFLHVNTNGGRMQFATPGQTHGHSCGANAFNIAATPVISGANGPYPNPFNSSSVVEPFSSDGPRKIFFNADSTPVTAGNFSSTGGINRQKPDITAADGVSVTGAGFVSNPFFGTGAAASHAAAIAALLKSAKPALTPAQIRSALTASAIDIEAPGVDRDSGAGIVMAYQALQAAGVTPLLTIGTVTADDTGGNANGFVEPGEQGTLIVQLINPSSVAATGISATLSTTTPGVFVNSATSTYPDIPPNGSANNNTPFSYTLSGDVVCPSTISFTLTVTYSGGVSPRVLNFTQSIGQSFTVSETLDLVAPANGTSGVQTGRLVRTGNRSFCGIPKANPGINAADATVSHRYDQYAFSNPTAATICVTITLTAPDTATANQLQSAAYAPTYVPARPDENYLGDIGGNGPLSRTYSVDVPAGTTFAVVVNQVTGSATPFPYTLTLTGLPCAATAANQPPVNTVPAAQTVAQNGHLIFSTANSNQISVADPDAGTAPLLVTLSATNGRMTLSGTSGLSFNIGDGTDDATMAFTGSIANVNAALNGASFAPTAGFTGSASLQITTNDQGFTGSGGAKSDSDTVNITVNAAGTLAFSAAAYSVAEDGGSATITVTRTGGSAGTAQVNYSTGDGSATAGSDYTATSGTLTFGNGVTLQTFTVPITNDTVPEGSESILLTLSNASGAGLGSPSSAILTINDNDPVPSPTPRSLNISTRGRVEGGDRVLIAGSIINGSVSKRILVRAIGPSLPSNVGTVLADPTVELHGPSGELLFSNDNWRDTQETEIQATGMPPANDLDSAIVATLNPGNFTVIVRGKNGATGVALVEIYDLDASSNSELANISTRGFVQSGNNVLIGGFILGAGAGSSDVIVRALGPSLPSSVGARLTDPTLELRNAEGALIRTNDNWQDDSAQKTRIQASGLAPSNANESAIAETLPQGAYTAIVAGKDDTGGIGLVEIYNQ